MVRALAGQQHGSSGRDQINLVRKCGWFFGTTTGTPSTRFASTVSSALVKKGPHDLGQSVFIGLPSDREVGRVVAIAGLDWPAEESRYARERER